MKLTKETLKRIIKEELGKVMSESLESQLQQSREAKMLLKYARSNNNNAARNAYSTITRSASRPGPNSKKDLEKMMNGVHSSIQGMDRELKELVSNYAELAIELIGEQGETNAKSAKKSSLAREHKNILRLVKEPVARELAQHKRMASVLKKGKSPYALEKFFDKALSENPIQIFEPAPGPATTFDELVLQAAMQSQLMDSYDDQREIKKAIVSFKKDPEEAKGAAYKILQSKEVSDLMTKYRSFLQKSGSFLTGKGFREE